MISLFNKKVYLKDYFQGMIDIHNHILPGIDDGAQNVEESVALIKKYDELGIKNFIASPHIMNDYYPNTPETIQAALELLKSRLQKENINVKIKAAAEYMMDQSFLELLESNNLLTLGADYVLVEMSYFQPPINLNEILFQLQTKSYKPVLAHPERYAYFHSRKLEKFDEMKTRGCYFQLNILAVTGHYGKNIRDIAVALLDNNMYDFIGTDTHQMRHLDKLSGIRLPKKRAKQLQALLENTSAVFTPFLPE